MGRTEVTLECALFADNPPPAWPQDAPGRGRGGGDCPEASASLLRGGGDGRPTASGRHPLAGHALPKMPGTQVSLGAGKSPRPQAPRPHHRGTREWSQAGGAPRSVMNVAFRGFPTRHPGSQPGPWTPRPVLGAPLRVQSSVPCLPGAGGRVLLPTHRGRVHLCFVWIETHLYLWRQQCDTKEHTVCTGKSDDNLLLTITKKSF